MRTLFFLTLTCALAISGYLYGPSLFQSDVVRDSQDLVDSLVSGGDSSALNHGLKHAKQGGLPRKSQATMRNDASESKAKQPPILRRKTSHIPSKKSVQSAQLPAAPAWQADMSGGRTEKDEVGDKLTAIEQKNLPDPMQKRWLNGSNVRVSFAKERVKQGCDQSMTRCDDIRATKEAKLMGLVVKTKHLVDRPLRPMEGHLQAGHFVEGTPAVYVD